jgi:hypothetical protein
MMRASFQLVGTGVEVDEEDLSFLVEDEVVGIDGDKLVRVGDVEGLAVDRLHHLGAVKRSEYLNVNDTGSLDYRYCEQQRRNKLKTSCL